jgi:hypothetical protein
MAKRAVLVITLEIEIEEAPDRRALREAGVESLQEYAEHVIEGMSLGDLDEYELTIKARRRIVAQ